MGQAQEHEGIRPAESQPLTGNAPELTGGGYSSSSKRIGYIDSLKGFGILCVVLGHVALGYVGSMSCPGSYAFYYTMENLIYAFHMPLFFCISGYVYRKAYFDGNGRAKYSKLFRQLLNLLIVYMLFSILFTVVKIPFNALTNAQSDLRDILWIWMRPIGVYWYLYVLIELYLLFAIPSVMKVKPALLLGGCVLLTTASFYLNGPFRVSDVLYYSLFFAAGILHAAGVSAFSKGGSAALSGIFAVTLTAVFWSNGTLLKDIPYANALIAACGSAIIWYIFENKDLLGKNRFLQYFGRHSLEIYVMHSVPITVARVLMNRRGLDNSLFCLAVAGTLGAGMPLLAAALLRKLRLYDLFFRPMTAVKSSWKELAS